jgi:HEAT repeat protein
MYSVRRWMLVAVLAVPAGIMGIPSSASAQCCCGHGSGSSMSSLAPLMMMQMQMQMQQQQFALQLQQLQSSKLQAVVQQMQGKDEEALKFALTDQVPEQRWAAIQIVGSRKLPMQKELIERLTDPSVDVRQAARWALIQLAATQLNATQGSMSMKMKSAKTCRGVDFGPAPQANRSAQVAAAKKWREWWARQPKADESSAARTSPGLK